MRMTRRAVGGLLVLGLLAGCQGRAPSTFRQPERKPVERKIEPIEAPGLHNVLRLSDTLYSGSSPEGDEGFASLRNLGIKTVISVDGARPDVERARKYGLRYVHLPIGYDGVPEEQAWRIARAVRDLPGPVYLHCHHGKHRGPAAAATALVCLDSDCPAEAAVAVLRQAGTDPRYTGLYASPVQVRRPTQEDLDRMPAEFPEMAEVTGLAQSMVRIDERWDRLKEVRAAGWKVPPGHPDLDPPHEALQLAEQYREAARLPEMTDRRSEEFRRWLADAEKDAADLEAILRRGKEKGTVDGATAEAQFRKAAADCARCHGKYRDVPQGR
jgi:protein tyrosine phosphatase (PTP) superfamily phosphohydrolase (DUF442 family)